MWDLKFSFFSLLHQISLRSKRCKIFSVSFLLRNILSEPPLTGFSAHYRSWWWLFWFKWLPGRPSFTFSQTIIPEIFLSWLISISLVSVWLYATLINLVCVLYDGQLPSIFPFCTEASLWFWGNLFVLDWSDAWNNRIGHQDYLLGTSRGKVSHFLFWSVSTRRFQSLYLLLSFNFFLWNCSLCWSRCWF